MTLPKLLRDACNGQPAVIPWPHRLLHDAADWIEALARGLDITTASEHWAALRAAWEKE